MIATTTAVPLSALGTLVRSARRRRSLLGGVKDEFPTALARHGRALEVFRYSGSLLPTVLTYLEQSRGIDLSRSMHDEMAFAISSARGSAHLILAEQHRPLASRLDDALHSPGELTAFLNRLGRTSEGEEVGAAMLEGIRFLRRALDAVGPGTVVLLAIL